MLQKWLLSIVDHLTQLEVKTTDQNVQRIVAAVTIACCIQSLVSLELISANDIGLDTCRLVNLLNLLHLFPACHSKRCKDYEFLESTIPEDYRDNVAKAVCGLCKFASTKVADPVPWLCAMPLVHFLKQQCVPFGVMDTTVENIKLIDSNIPLPLTSERTWNKKAFKYVISYDVYSVLYSITSL